MAKAIVKKNKVGGIILPHDKAYGIAADSR